MLRNKNSTGTYGQRPTKLLILNPDDTTDIPKTHSTQMYFVRSTV